MKGKHKAGGGMMEVGREEKKESSAAESLMSGMTEACNLTTYKFEKCVPSCFSVCYCYLCPISLMMAVTRII